MSGSRISDVAVIGGGPAGAATAAAARSRGLEVTLVDAGPGARTRPGESLPPGTEELAAEIFGPDAIEPESLLASHGNRSAWGGGEAVDTDFVLNPFGDGAHVDRLALDAALRDSLRGAGVRVLADTSLSGIARTETCWQLRLAGAGDGSATARVVVDASGRSAQVARSQGARRARLDRLVAEFVLLGSTARDPDTATLVEAVEDGWWYSTPLAGGRRIAAFLTDADLLPARRLRTPAGWRARLAGAPNVHSAIAERGYALRDGPHVTDASTTYLDRLTGPGWLAVGDAAVSFDPLSSQGILTALLMGREAGNALATMLAEPDPAPIAAYAADYARVLSDHLRQAAACYEAERRWPGAPFWARRRRSSPGLTAVAA